jgi:hydrogenase maturation factor
MCTSRYFRVIDAADDTSLLAEDVDGHRLRLALIAYDGPPPQPGSWVVAHAGYALAPAEADEAAYATDEIRRFDDARHRDDRSAAGTSKEAS